MAESEKWQHVGKSKLKTKSQKQEALKNMPKAQNLDIGSAALQQLLQQESEDVGEPLRDASNIKPGHKSLGKLANKKRGKRVASDVKSAYKNLNDALQNGNFSLEDKLIQMKDRFPDNPLIWLKEISSELNMVLKFPDEPITFSAKPFDYPLCKTKKSTTNFLTDLFGKDTNAATVPLIFQHLVNSLLEYIARDYSVWGYKLCLQALTHSHPDLCCNEMEKYKEKLQSVLNIPKQCVALLWAMGQTGFTNSKCGMKVWLELMLPHLHAKNVAQYSMPYIEMIMKQSNNKTVELLSGTLSVSHFIVVLELCYGDQSAPKSFLPTREKMQQLYPTFRQVITKSNSNKRQVFKFLLQQSGIEAKEVASESTSIAVECLQKDQQCWKMWRELYTNSLFRTRILLYYIVNNWEKALQTLPKKALKETIRTFQNTNADAEARSDALVEKREFNDVRNLCEEINGRLFEPAVKRAPLLRIILLACFIAFFAFLVGHVTYDVQAHGGVWQKSDTYAFLKSKGIIDVAVHVWSRIEEFVNVVARWLQSNVPFYWNMASEILGPYIAELQSGIQWLFAWVAENTHPLRIWMYDVLKATFVQVETWAKMFSLKFLEVLDVCLGYAYVFATWCFGVFEVIFQSLMKLYNGEISWVDTRKAMLEEFTILTSVLKRWFQNVANYVAPDNP